MSVVVIVLPKLEDAKKIRKILKGHGFPQVFAYATASAALSEIREHESGMVISGYHLKDMYIRNSRTAFPLTSNWYFWDLQYRQCADTGILSLTTPLKVYDLVNTAEMVLHQMERMQRKPENRNGAVNGKKNYIKNAKALLMERNHLTEEEAHRYIQKSSMDNGTNNGRDSTDDPDLTV